MNLLTLLLPGWFSVVGELLYPPSVFWIVPTGSDNVTASLVASGPNSMSLSPWEMSHSMYCVQGDLDVMFVLRKKIIGSQWKLLAIFSLERYRLRCCLVVDAVICSLILWAYKLLQFIFEGNVLMVIGITQTVIGESLRLLVIMRLMGMVRARLKAWRTLREENSLINKRAKTFSVDPVANALIKQAFSQSQAKPNV